VRHRAAPQHLAQFVGAAGPRLADDLDRVRGDLARVRPLQQEGRDRLVEELVRRARGPDHVVLDLPPRHRLEDRLAGAAVAPAAPVDQQPALGVRVQGTDLAQQLRPGRLPEPLRRKHQGDVLAGGGERLQLRRRLLRRGEADDAVAARVAVDQLTLDLAERTLVFVDG
jgi:hypothetical protein